MLSEQEAKAENRRQKILQNAENRLRKIQGLPNIEKENDIPSKIEDGSNLKDGSIIEDNDNIRTYLSSNTDILDDIRNRLKYMKSEKSINDHKNIIRKDSLNYHDDPHHDYTPVYILFYIGFHHTIDVNNSLLISFYPQFSNFTILHIVYYFIFLNKILTNCSK
ncbi:unnamed protein product [Gordionus sp. m RMFG-2023]